MVRWRPKLPLPYPPLPDKVIPAPSKAQLRYLGIAICWYRPKEIPLVPRIWRLNHRVAPASAMEHPQNLKRAHCPTSNTESPVASSIKHSP